MFVLLPSFLIILHYIVLWEESRCLGFAISFLSLFPFLFVFVLVFLVFWGFRFVLGFGWKDGAEFTV